jgi:hypothetical protein
VEDDVGVTRIPTPAPPLVTPDGTALSDLKKTETLADSLESQFQPVNDQSDPAVIEKLPRRCKHTLMPLQASLI